MSLFRAPFLKSVLLLAITSGVMFAQARQCSIAASMPPIHAGGLTERTGDIIISCTGGQAATADVQLTANSAITSQAVGGATEALLLVDEPVSQVLGTNTFRGTHCGQGATGLCWQGVPLSGTTTLRITNVKVNATAITQSVGAISITAGQAVTISNPTNPIAIVLTSQAFRPDFDLDRYIDVIWQDPTTGLANIWYLGEDSGVVNVGSSSFPLRGVKIIAATSLTNSNAWRIAGTGDFDGDGRPDLVWQDPATGSAQVWFMTGRRGTLIKGAAFLTSANPWRIRSIADLNRDGKPDILWQDPVSGAAQVWFMTGGNSSTFGSAAFLTSTNTWRLVGSADFNGDDRPDVVWQDPTTGVSQVWFLGGALGNSVTGTMSLTSGNTWRISAVADFNFDGHPDLIWQDQNTGNSAFWLLGGVSGNQILQSVTFSPQNNWRIAGPR